MKFKVMFLACFTAAICSHVQAFQRPPVDAPAHVWNRYFDALANRRETRAKTAARIAAGLVTPDRPTKPTSTDAPIAGRKL